MSACCDLEWRETTLSPRDRAVARDSYVREFERRFNDWSDIAKVCYEVERDKDYELLGFRSFGAWIIAAAPRSRAYIYLVTGRYKELKDDFSDQELSEIALDSTATLRKLSPAVRKDPEVRAAAKKKPQELRQVVIERHPDQLVEEIVEKSLRFTGSQWKVIEGAFQSYREREQDETASLEDFVEWLITEVYVR
jgi:hypothetical protein